jgi:xylulokinase
MATYEGALAGLLDALDRIAAQVGGAPSDASLILIGGGAGGRIWQETAQRLSGRPVRIPAEPELVALGAAVQAASVLGGEAGTDIARRWATSVSGDQSLDPVPPDLERLERIRRVRELAADLADGGGRR